MMIGSKGHRAVFDIRVKGTSYMIYESLKRLNESDFVPMHMPGHKRNPSLGDMSAYYDIDITEIDDFDNLHDAEGIILEAERRANDLYGADETHFLVNGSTCGVLAAVSACVPKGGKLIAARNCHKSLYHAAYLRELRMKFIYPEKKIFVKDGFGSGKAGAINDGKTMGSQVIYGRIDHEKLKSVCEENPDAKAVFITSPTYEGIPSDIEKIASVVHGMGMILIVDEAHGAHFGMSDNLPKSAVSQGADVVIHSVHKTLASMTQTALIHVQGQRVDRQRLKRFLRIYQSSSPSYILMSSIDSCINDINQRGDEIFEKVIEYRRRIETDTADCKNLFVPGTRDIADPCKVLICSAAENVTGQNIYDILRIEHHIQLEMAGDFYGLAIITGYDSDENIDRLISAIRSIDHNIENDTDKKSDKHADVIAPLKDESDNDTFDRKPALSSDYGEEDKAHETVIDFCKAWDGETELVDITTATGRIAGDFINLYPPGIPLIIPGEKFSKELIRQISFYLNTGRNVQGVFFTQDAGRLVKILKRV